MRDGRRYGYGTPIPTHPSGELVTIEQTCTGVKLEGRQFVEAKFFVGRSQIAPDSQIFRREFGGPARKPKSLFLSALPEQQGSEPFVLEGVARLLVDLSSRLTLEPLRQVLVIRLPARPLFRKARFRRRRRQPAWRCAHSAGLWRGHGFVLFFGRRHRRSSTVTRRSLSCAPFSQVSGEVDRAFVTPKSQTSIPELPKDAVERVKERWPDGRPRGAEYWVGEELVFTRYWDDEGQLIQHDSWRGGKRHGPNLSWYDNGVLAAETFYVDGLEHGIARQYDWDGKLIGTYEMDHGTGADLWYWEAGQLAEERYYCAGLRHGIERWWGSDARIWDEQHYHHGEAHGVFRRWNSRGSLRRGFPKYFVNGAQVTKRQYLRAAAHDPTLPPFRIEENDPTREPPSQHSPSDGE